MKKLLFHIVAAVCCLPLPGIAQGPLTPPGPPGPTMKTLDQLDAKLEKRIPISTTPFDITKAGSYYLTQNVSGSAPGITVKASGVVIDLNGFTISGPGKEAAGTGSGIVGLDDTVVRDGRVTDFGDDGVRLGAATVVENLDVANVGGSCITVGEQSRVQYCRAGAGAKGIVVGLASIVDHCISIGNTAGSAGAGIVAGPFGTVANSVSSYNNGDGVSAGDGAIVTSCTAANNNGSGIVATVGATVRECALRANHGAGVSVAAKSTVKSCTVSDYGTDGIRVTTSSTVLENHVTDNFLVNIGIHVVGTGNGAGNRIEANQVMDAYAGIQVDSGGNLIIKNSVGQAVLDTYKIAINNSMTIVKAALSAAAVDGTSGGNGVGTTDPWANFSY